jgi:hypothetical protein
MQPLKEINSGTLEIVRVGEEAQKWNAIESLGLRAFV